jgi:hypothetical protein
VDGVSIDGLIAEIAPLVVGRHLGRPRLAGPHAATFEVSADREHRLWLEAGRGRAGLYRLRREAADSLGGLAAGEASGRARQALLLLRKHLRGARVAALRRVPGERTIVLEAGSALLILRLSGPAPAMTLVVDGAPVATMGDGPVAWPLPPAAPEKEWRAVDAAAVAAAFAAAEAGGDSPVRAVLRECPPLGPQLARLVDTRPETLLDLRARLSRPQPTLVAPGPPADWHDRDLVGADAVALLPIALPTPGRVALPASSWQEAAALFLEARLRGALFDRRRRVLRARSQVRRLERLEARLEQDVAGIPDTSRLRREAEALLAFAGSLPPDADVVEIPDPYEPDRRLRLAVDPRLSGPANAERRFEKARRMDRARGRVEARLRETRTLLEAERARESRLVEARDLSDLERHAPEGARPDAAERARDAAARGGPRHYLTSRGLSLLVGRGAKENHRLTFTVAGPEDLWLHVRDAPGAHVVLRDGEGRAAPDDLREAGEVAAFFSEARGSSAVDVHVTRRKHLRPARGGPGRVLIAHSDTLRVAPRDPEGRLRRR